MNQVAILLPIIDRGLTDDQLVNYMTNCLQELLNSGALKGTVEDLLVDYKINRKSSLIKIIVDSSYVAFPNRLGAVGASMCGVGNYISRDKVVLNKSFCKPIKSNNRSSRYFSVASINERLRMIQLGPKLRFKRTVFDYKRYWSSNSERLISDPETLVRFKNLFLSDVMSMFTEVLPLIEEGKQLSTLLGVNQISPELGRLARSLSLSYKKVLKTEKRSGQIPKVLYQKLKQDYTEFMKEFMGIIFPSMMDPTPDNPDSEVITQQVNESARKFSSRKSKLI